MRLSSPIAVLTVLLTLAVPVCAAATLHPPSQPGVDAPELARLGPVGVGHRVLHLVHGQQLNLWAVDAVTGVVPRQDRSLAVDLWYPARVTSALRREVYHGTLSSEPPLPPAAFTVPGVAVRNAKAILGRYPLVVVSHGYGNDTAAFSWLGENLASKGYVVAAIRHVDPEYSDRKHFAWPVLRRPLDIAFVAGALQEQLGAEGLIDASRTALFGYSMGGYGVLTGAGATLDAASPMVSVIPGKALTPYARDGAERDFVRVKHLQAVVAMAPAGGGASNAWGEQGVAEISAPLLLIAGNQDRTVDYATGARRFFETAVHVPRYLLTYREGGHSIGLAGSPPEMQSRLWNLDWFEDPVWRKERVVAINLHFITAFLDLYVKGDETRRAYLEGLPTDANPGRWPDKPAAPYDAFSPGSVVGNNPGITLWKGFQDRHAVGLTLEVHAPQSR